MRTLSISILILAIAVAVVSAAPKQCTEGGCCDIPKGLFKPAGTICDESKHECLEANSSCDGFNAKCNRKPKADGTECKDGSCKAGVCVSSKSEKPKKEEKKEEKPKKEETKKEEKKPKKEVKKVEEKKTVTRPTTRDMAPKDAVKTLMEVAVNQMKEQKILDQLRQEQKEDTERASNYFINGMLKRTIDKIVDNNSPSKRLTRKLSAPQTKEGQKLEELLMKDSRNRMKFFEGLKREMLKANRAKFYKREDNKATPLEKFSEDIQKEHKVIRRHIKQLEDVGYYQQKYYNAPLVTPTVATNATSTASSKKSLMATMFQGKTGGVNIAALVLAGIAVIAFVVIVVVLVGGKKKEQPKYKKEEFEKF